MSKLSKSRPNPRFKRQKTRKSKERRDPQKSNQNMYRHKRLVKTPITVEQLFSGSKSKDSQFED